MTESESETSAKVSRLLLQPTQRSMLPIEITQLSPRTSGRHNMGWGIATNGGTYLIKGAIPKFHFLPANEWICSSLAQKVSIDIPPFEILTNSMFSKVTPSLYFGSERQQGLITNPATVVNIFKTPKKHAHLDAALSRLHAFDLFVHNADRHPSNILLKLDVQGNYQCMAIDFSCAFLANSFPQSELLSDPNSSTMSLFSKLRITGRFDLSAARDTLDQLDGIPEAYVRNVLVSMPSSWLSDATGNQIQNWWRSPARHERIQAIRRRLDNVAGF